jgi:hypothetical protein
MRQSTKWEKRILIAAIVLIGGVVLSHGLWSYLAGRGMRGRIAALKSANEPIEPGDFAAKDPDGADNAGVDLAAVAKEADAYEKGGTNPLFTSRGIALPLRAEEKQDIQTALTELAPALARLDQARAKPRADWKLDLTSPVLFNIMLQKMSGHRHLCTVLCSAALLDHENGDDASALARLDRAIFLSRYMDKHPTLVGHLVSIGCMAMVSSHVFEIAPDLKIGTEKGDASLQDVRKLIDQLLDDQPPMDGLHLAFKGERMAEVDSVQCLINGTPIQLTNRGQDEVPGSGNAVMRYLLRPVFYHNASFMIDHMNATMPCLDAPDYPAAKPMIAPKQADLSPVNFLAMMLIPAMERAIETHHRCTSDRRLAATALAIRWYAVDHNGQRPASLGELVPKYLPFIPKDALLRDKPLGYVPDPADPRLYSAGYDNVDDGGSEAWLKRPHHAGPPRRGDEWQTLDRVVHLNRPKRPTPEEEKREEETIYPSKFPADETPATEPATTEPAP